MASSRCWELEKKKKVPKNYDMYTQLFPLGFFVWKKTKRAVERSISYRLCKMDNFSCWPKSWRTRKQMLYIRHGDDDVHYRKRGNHLLKLREQLYRYYRDDVYTLYTLQQSINWLFFSLFSLQTVGLCCQLSVGVVKEKKDGKWVYPRKKRNKGVSINFSCYMPWQRTDVRTAESALWPTLKYVEQDLE